MSDSNGGPCCCCGGGREADVQARRGFFAKVLAVLLGVGAYLTPVLAGVASFLNPLRQKRQTGQFMRLATLDALPSDGTPLKTTVTMDRVDAWNRMPNQPVGAVFLRLVDPQKKEVRAIHVVCPHAGCFVTYDAAKKGFFCPCHNANFDIEGRRLDATSSSPRDLDTLECKVEGDAVWVRYQNFRTGTSEKIAET